MVIFILLIPPGPFFKKLFVFRVPLSRARELVEEFEIESSPGLTRLLSDEPMDGDDEGDGEDEDDTGGDNTNNNKERPVDRKQDNASGKASLLI